MGRDAQATEINGQDARATSSTVEHGPAGTRPCLPRHLWRVCAVGAPSGPIRVRSGAPIISGCLR
jgi:hypothetical protein